MNDTQTPIAGSNTGDTTYREISLVQMLAEELHDTRVALKDMLKSFNKHNIFKKEASDEEIAEKEAELIVLAHLLAEIESSHTMTLGEALASALKWCKQERKATEARIRVVMEILCVRQPYEIPKFTIELNALHTIVNQLDMVSSAAKTKVHRISKKWGMAAPSQALNQKAWSRTRNLRFIHGSDKLTLREKAGKPAA